MAQKKTPEIYSKETLQEMLSYIELYWHRHGGEEQEKLERYIRRLHDALPKELTLGQSISVPLGEFSEGLFGILRPLGYSKYELEEEFGALKDYLQTQGGGELCSDGTLDIRPAKFKSAFDGYFSTADLTDATMEQLAELRDGLVS